jgi:tripartite-type tricarboxylate transporter receptor subunit TctC
MSRVAASAFAAGILLGFCSAVAAQAFPSRPVRIIATFPAGNSGDVAIRLAAPAMGAGLGQPVLVENRPAAGGQVAAVAVKQASPDGYTTLISTSAPMVSARYLVKNIPYDTLTDFTPITKVISVPSVFAISSAVPAHSVPELIEYAKRNPGKLAYGSTGNGTAFHMIGESLSLDAGIQLLHVPYAAAGMAQPVADLANDRIQIFFPTIVSLGPQMKTGKVRILAVLDRSRLPQIPDVPAITEVYPGYTVLPSWFAYMGPAGLPGPVATRLQSELRKALFSPETSAKLEAMGSTPVGNTPAEFAEEIRASIAAVGKVVRSLGIEPQ